MTKIKDLSVDTKGRTKTFNHVPFQLIFYPNGSSHDIQKRRFYHLNPPEMAILTVSWIINKHQPQSLLKNETLLWPTYAKNYTYVPTDHMVNTRISARK